MLEGCVEKRQREIAAGRRCAKRALAQLSVVDYPLLAGSDRAPVWPPGVVGSITHTDGCRDGYCGVAVTDRQDVVGLGIDAEPRQPLPADLWSWILDEREKADALLGDEPGIYARLVFSAKEATYKALYPTLKRILEFCDLHIEFKMSDGLFFAHMVGLKTAPPRVPAPFVGRLVIDNELIVTAMALVRDAFPPAHEGLSQPNVPC